MPGYLLELERKMIDDEIERECKFKLKTNRLEKKISCL